MRCHSHAAALLEAAAEDLYKSHKQATGAAVLVARFLSASWLGSRKPSCMFLHVLFDCLS